MIDSNKYNNLKINIQNANEEIIDKVLNVDINKIQENELNFYNDEYNLEQLQEEIKTKGQIEPIIVTKEYKILSGHRRYKALVKNNAKQILVRIDKNNYSKEENLLTLIQSNSYREKSIKEVDKEIELLNDLYVNLKNNNEKYKNININKLISDKIGKSERTVIRRKKAISSEVTRVTSPKTKQDKLNDQVLKLYHYIQKNNDEIEFDYEFYKNIEKHIKKNNQIELNFKGENYGR